jgi:predicted esterase
MGINSVVFSLKNEKIYKRLYFIDFTAEMQLNFSVLLLAEFQCTLIMRIIARLLLPGITMKYWFTFLMLSTLMIRCSFSTGINSPAANFKISDSSITLDTGTMYYTLAVHRTYEQNPPVALILALHYGGEATRSTPREFLDALIIPAYRQVRAAIVAPMVLPAGSWDNEQSEKFLLALIEKIKAEYVTHPDRVLVMGYSLGAIGSWYMASRNPDLFTACIPVSGSIPSSVQPIDRLPPTFVIHSRQDEVFAYSKTEKDVNDLTAKGLPVELFTVEGISHYETSAFQNALEKSVSWLTEIW